MTTTTLRAQGVDELDALLSTSDVFLAPPDPELRARLLRQAVAHHLEHNPAFARFSAGLDPASVQPDTLDTLPLLPSGVFKRAADLVRTGDAPVVLTSSSGTLGTVSRVPRDDTTLMRFFASVSAATHDLLDVEHTETTVHNLGPRVEESQHLWISYVMSGVAVLHETEFWVRGDALATTMLLETLRAEDPDLPSVLVGPPPVLWDLARVVAEGEPLPRHARRRVVTIGGWKRRQGQSVRPEVLGPSLVSAFGLRSTADVRDAFNMVELNTIVLECGRHAKHVPPWLYVSARDAHTLAPAPAGEPGLLAYCDPTPTSFPGMVLSEDFGWVDRDVSCPCGVTGDVLRIERRVNRLESRGCALKI
jgi:long-chain-fatty-acid---luciferin-component ligase